MTLTAAQIHDNKILEDIENSFIISLREMKDIAKSFHSEMERGLSGRKSSLKMIPTYVDRPTGGEKGHFFALDLGGTNFRVLEIELKGNGRINSPVAERFVLEKKYITGQGADFFDFIADCIKKFLNKRRFGAGEKLDLGFTFSFPLRQTGIASGILLHWTKGFSAKGVLGNDVVKLLEEALARNGVDNIRVSALANDTVGTLVAKSYEDPLCDIGIILGTGTNACYVEKVSNIKKWRDRSGQAGRMIINIEWGNFNRLRLTSYDKRLDKESENPGEQVLEKMVSGMYLGELVRLILDGLIKRKAFFCGATSSMFTKKGRFKTEYISVIESDSSKGLNKIDKLLENRLGISESMPKDRVLIKKICEAVSKRGARVSAAALAAIIRKTDKGLSRRHTIAIDGTLYERNPNFSANMRRALKEIFGKKASRIRIVLAKDGSGVGAAIIAAVAAGV